MSEATILNIIITEDDPDDQLLLQEAFRQSDEGNSITIANDGVELMDFLEEQREARGSTRPDLVLLDLNMPRMDGREALAAIKGDPDLRSIPVVVLTTSSDEGDILKSYALGANSYICKPVTFTELVDIVEHLQRYWFGFVQLPPRDALPAA
ncbi:MAG: response regulator [Verrucomicrobia bacterium]|nr:response regulator [Verrucomicrobiota bacterium]